MKVAVVLALVSLGLVASQSGKSVFGTVLCRAFAHSDKHPTLAL